MAEQIGKQITAEEFGEMRANIKTLSEVVAKQTDKLAQFLENKPCQNHEGIMKTLAGEIRDTKDSQGKIWDAMRKNFWQIVALVTAGFATIYGVIIYLHTGK